MGAGIAQWSAARGLRVLLKDINAAARRPKASSPSERCSADAAKRRVFTQADAQAGFRSRGAGHRRRSDARGGSRGRSRRRTARPQEENLRLTRSAGRAGDRARHEHLRAFHRQPSPRGLRIPSRVVGIHFFNPVHRMQLVEIVRGPRTDAATMNTALGYVKGIGKLPVIVKDSPGFLVNRILLPYMAEALRLYFEEGYDAARIDRHHARLRDADGAVAADGRGGRGRGQPCRTRSDRASARLHAHRRGRGSRRSHTMIANGWLGRKRARASTFTPAARRATTRLPPLQRGRCAPHAGHGTRHGRR